MLVVNAVIYFFILKNMKKNFLFKWVSVLGAMLLLATSVMPGLQYAYAESTSTEASWDYVHDENSWQTAYGNPNSALKAYEDYYRYEDLWNDTLGRRALLDDIRCNFSSYADENWSNPYANWIIKGVKYAPWFNTNYNEVEVVENSVPWFVGTHFYLKEDAINLDLIENGSDTLYKLYTNSDLSTPAGIWVKIDSCSYPNFTKSWKAWNATAWAVVKLPKPFRGTISISYNWADPVYPWWEKVRDFDKGFWVEHISNITAYDASTFDPDKLKVTLLAPVACIEKGADDDCYGSLRAAVDHAANNDTIYLVADDEVSFNSTDSSTWEIAITDGRNLTIDWNNHYIQWVTNAAADETYWHDIYVSWAGNVTIKNLTIKNFGDTLWSTNRYTSPIYVGKGYTWKLTLDKVTINTFNRQAIHIWNWQFDISNLTINGSNGSPYQQGIEIFENGHGTIKNSSISGIKWSTDWDAYAIGNFGNWTVTVTDTTINNSDYAVAVWTVNYDETAAETTAWKLILWAWNDFTATTDVLAISSSAQNGEGKNTATDSTTSSIEVTAGSYNGAIEKSDKESDASAKIEISGWKFSVDPTAYVVAWKYAKSISEGALKYEVDVKPSSSSSWWGGGGSSKKSETTKTDDAKANTWDTATVDETKTDETKADEPKTAVDANNNGTADTAISFSQEFKDAYKFAHDNGITTKDSIEEADMYGPLTRIAMAKMLSQYAINVLGKTPDTSKVVPNFPDVDAQLDADYNNWVTLAYQLGIMWIGIEEFRPFDLVTRAEFGTALSRMLYGTADGEGNEWYSTHLEKLMNEKIITNDNPQLQELRGYVMIMLMRSAQ